MTYQLKQADIDAYDADGAVLLKAVIDQESLAAVAAAVWTHPAIPELKGFSPDRRCEIVKNYTIVMKISQNLNFALRMLTACTSTS